MKLEFWKPTAQIGTVKLTVHRNGNLGFSQGAAQKLNVSKNGYVKIATNVEDRKDQNLYMIINKNDDEESLKVNKAGDYYYLNTKAFFNEMGIDYKKKKIIYDIVELDVNNNKVYKLIKREIERKNKK